MHSRLMSARAAALVAIALAFTIVSPGASAQDSSSAGYRVLIDGVAAGSATGVMTSPTDAVVLRQDSNPKLPSTQIASDGQGTIMLTTGDTTLISAIQMWMKADNVGYKDTVQRKTVEIDRVGRGVNARYRLSGAWPIKLETSATGSTITIVYQQLTSFH